MEPIHKSVLLKESLDLLKVREGGRYIDATLGQAGHALEIVERGGEVLGIEANVETLKWLKSYFQEEAVEAKARKMKVILGNFADLEKLARANGFVEVDGIIFDLGLSTFLLRGVGRGFSYRGREPLDMRFNPTGTETAANILNTYSEREIYEIFTKFGEERGAGRLARALVRARGLKKFETTEDLADLVETAFQPMEGSAHLAQVFQALRIVVNGELESLGLGLEDAQGLLKKGGRLAVISYHSLEDRLVKRLFLKWQGKGWGQVVGKGVITPSPREVEFNRAARSSKLRAYEKN